jgi:hypothetical protein
MSSAEIEHPANRMTLLGSIAKVQHKLKRDKEAWTTLEHAIEAVAATRVWGRLTM